MKLPPTAKTLSFFHASDKFPADLLLLRIEKAGENFTH